MNNELVEINLHGHLGEAIGSKWDLAVESVSEAIHAIEIITKKLNKYLYEKDKEGAQYQVLINGNDFTYEEGKSLNDIETLKNSELVMSIPALKTIDIVPVIEGSDSSTLAIVGGVLLIIIGIFVPVIGAALIIGGIGLIAAGVINLLSSPPQFEDFREIQGGGRASYIFNGPENTTREGGPVPLGYGRLLVGSHVIAASYNISDVETSAGPLTI